LLVRSISAMTPRSKRPKPRDMLPSAKCSQCTLDWQAGGLQPFEQSAAAL
jgi:hypothetical protein